MNRELAKKKVMSRDCHCVKGKDRDNNYNIIIDEIFDWHESEVKKLSIHGVVGRSEQLCDCKNHSIKTSYGFEICTKCGNEFDS